MEPLNVHDYELLARERLDENAWEYFRGGAGDESTLRENTAAFARWKLRPRVLWTSPTSTRARRCSARGLRRRSLSRPSRCSSSLTPRPRPRRRAAARPGTIMVLSTSATMRPGAVAAAAPDAPRWFQVYVFRDRGITQSLIDEACEHGYSALVLTVDVPILGRREGADPDRLPHSRRVRGRGRHLRRHRPERQLARSRVARGARPAGRAQGSADARGREPRRRARRRGRRRVQSRRPPTRRRAGVHRRAASRSSRPSRAVRRSCSTAASAAASTSCARLRSAREAVLVGRPIVYALAAGGEEGVAHVLQLLRDEVELGLRLLGCTSPCRGHAGACRMDAVILARHGESIFSERGLVNGEVAVPGPLTRRGADEARALGRADRGRSDRAVHHDGVRANAADRRPRARRAARPAPRRPRAERPALRSLRGRAISRTTVRGPAPLHRTTRFPAVARAGGASSSDTYGASGSCLRGPSAALVVAHSLPIAYVLAARDGTLPARRVPLVEHAHPYRFAAEELERAVTLLEGWCVAPTW